MATKNGVETDKLQSFGDPEAMNVLSILETDFIKICHGIISGKLDQVDVRFKNKATVCKYAVPEGHQMNQLKEPK